MITVLICDDQDIVCEGLQRILESDAEIMVVGLAHNGLEALESIPDSAVCLKIGPYRLEILQSSDNRVKSVRAWHGKPKAHPESTAQG